METPTDTKKVITWLELMKHSTKHDCWIMVDEKVFDVTTYLAEHPGGDDILLKNSGKDATQAFRDVGHTDYASSLRDQRQVGVIEKGEQPAEYKEWLAKNQKQTTKVTWQQLKKHNKDGDCWVVLDGKVYDLSRYLEKHPGGPAPILGRAGKDATQAFLLAKHPNSALVEREEYLIGNIYGTDDQDSSKDKDNGFSIVHVIIALIIAAIGYYFFVGTQQQQQQ